MLTYKKSRSITFGRIDSDFFVCINICHCILAACTLKELLEVSLKTNIVVEQRYTCLLKYT